MHPGLIHRCHLLPGKLLSYIEIFFSYWVSIKWKIVLLHPDSIITHLTRMKTLLYAAPDCEELELDSLDVLCQSSGDFEPIDENDGRWS